MGIPFYQICYTYVENAREEKGQRATNYSEGTTLEMRESFQRSQGSNYARITDSELVYELLNDGDYCYATWIQFGLHEEATGRPRSFSCGFALNAQDVWHDPNLVAGILRENYHFSLAETEQPPRELWYRDPPFTFNTALGVLSLSEQSWQRLVERVFVTLVKVCETRIVDPLSIQIPLRDDAFAAGLYTILSILPYPLRRMASFVSREVPQAKPKAFIMSSDRVASAKQFVDLQDALACSYLSDYQETLLNSYSFIGYIKNCAYAPCSEQAGLDGYLNRLQGVFENLGTVEDALLFKALEAAHLVIQFEDSPGVFEGFSVDELVAKLSMLFALGMTNNQFLDKLAVFLLKELVQQGYFVSDDQDFALGLSELLEHTDNKDLKEVGLNYQIQRIEYLTEEEGISELTVCEKKNPDVFAQYYAILSQSESGLALLDAYYAHAFTVSEMGMQERIADFADKLTLLETGAKAPGALPGGMSVRFVQQVSARTSGSGPGAKTRDTLLSATQTLFLQQALTPGKEAQAFANYKELLRNIAPGNASGLLSETRKAFWSAYDVSRLDIRTEGYGELADDSSEISKEVTIILHWYKSLSECIAVGHDATETFHRLINQEASVFKSQDDYLIFLKKLGKALLEDEESLQQKPGLRFWYFFAQQLQVDPIQFLTHYKMWGSSNEQEEFLHAINEWSSLAQDDSQESENLEDFARAMAEYVKKKEPEYQIVRERRKIVQKVLNQRNREEGQRSQEKHRAREGKIELPTDHRVAEPPEDKQRASETQGKKRSFFARILDFFKRDKKKGDSW